MSQLGEIGEISTGEVLDGRYRLQERIGEGGTARVYRAEDILLGRTVAVKVLRAPLDGIGSPERAQSETALLASLNHHGLVTLFDARVSEDDGSYLVMEYVEGITLWDRMSCGPLESAEAASLTVDIAEALHVAHLAGIVHRDIKPSNILLWRSPVPGQGWRAKIADFGIAYLLDSARVTTPGLMVGTVAYIAPEQARGAIPSPAADIYALGIVLIEALTGKRPFAEAEGIGTVMARLQGPPAIADSLDEDWQRLLRGMTAMRPDDRPTAVEVAVAASRLAGGAAVAAAAGSAAEPTAAAAYVPADTTQTTAVLPLVAAGAVAGGAGGAAGAVGAGGASDAGGGGAGGAAVVTAGAARPRLTRRRGTITSFAVGVLLVASLVGAAIWSAGLPMGTPAPTPSHTTQQQATQPSVVPTPSPAAVAPAAQEGNGSSGSGKGSRDENGNSGPGNNSGGGKGKGSGKSGND